MTLHDLLIWMVSENASDLHLASGTPPVMRRNGALQAHPTAAPLTPDALATALEAITSESERVRLDAQRELDKGLDVDGIGRFRVNVAYERGSLYFSFRLVNSRIASIEELSLPRVCDRLTQLPRGLVLVTGPTGSGKSTTLAAMIDRINERDARHIVTVEDPIEYLHGNKRSIINQREVGSDTRSFGEALRHVLRQDPDVILIGEMRDLDTMASAITAAETGHLVFATLHTPDAPQTIDRIIDSFPSDQQQQIRLQLSMVLEAVISQVLVPAASGDGRIAVCEVMLGTPAIRNLVREAKSHQISTTIATGAALGMRTLDQALAELVASMAITREEALGQARVPAELERLLAGRPSIAA
ncbi:MAG: type IV pilus twitching motility protein PilT [Dehalococcoidia bacterium]